MRSVLTNNKQGYNSTGCHREYVELRMPLELVQYSLKAFTHKHHTNDYFVDIINATPPSIPIYIEQVVSPLAKFS